MRALSIRQPWAELILRAVKTVEYRSRATRIVGERFWIYASKGKGTKALRHEGTEGEARKVAVWSEDLAVPGEPLPEWMVEMARMLRLIGPESAGLPTGGDRRQRPTPTRPEAAGTPNPAQFTLALPRGLHEVRARAEHQLVVVDPRGAIVLSLRFADDAAGWAQFRQKLAAFPSLGVAIETNCGPAVERLLDLGLALYPLNPKAAERYRDRKAPAGAKDDALDAWSFADALRTDGHGWRLLRPQDPLTTELRLLCRDEVALIEQRTALVNQLRAALREYYPAALDAFHDWTAEGPWRFVIAFPSPAALVKAGRRKQERFLHAHKLYRPQTAGPRLAVFADALAFASPNPAVTRAKALLAVTLAKQLCSLESHLKEYRARIADLFGDHPDHGCFGSLPGAGAKIAPRLLAELGADRAVFATAEALQSYAGTAPVIRQSGRSRFVTVRRACNKTLRATVHLWANLSRKGCVWADVYYQKKRADGMGHAAALRCLGLRWMKILWTMWQTRTAYDEAAHTRNQVRHGSWVVGLLPANPATPTAH